MRRHRVPVPESFSEEEEDEEDAFTALSKRNRTASKRAKTATEPSAVAVVAEAPNFSSSAPASAMDANTFTEATTQSADSAAATTTSTALPMVNTSSMKRHHKLSHHRKQKMDAILQELKVETLPEAGHHSRGGGGYRGREREREGRGERQSFSLSASQFEPEKKGSFVEPGEEHLTTNIFVGNLAPSITEEELTDLFRQFGEAWLVVVVVHHFCCCNRRMRLNCTRERKSLPWSSVVVRNENMIEFVGENACV